MSAAGAGLRVVIDARRCVGTSNCAEEAPEAFEMDDDNHPRAVPGASRETLVAGARACPVCAITLHDAATGERIAP